MNILCLDQFSEMGGAQKSLLDLIPAFLERGWQTHAALPGQGPLIAKLRGIGVGVHPIACGAYNPGAKSAADVLRFSADVARQTRVIRELIDQTGVEMVYANGPRLWPATAIVTEGCIPVLMHAHIPFPIAYQRQIVRWSIHRACATVVACSHYVGTPLRKYVPAGDLHVIPHGTADLGFRRRKFGQGARWRIGVIGRVVPDKGQKEFLRAAALISRRFKGAQFVICGAPMFGGPGYLEEVRALARNLPVEFLGWRDDVGAVLSDLDLLAIPSLEEGLSRVMIEAFSAGVPVVAFPVGGIADGIMDGVTGFFTSDVAPDALAARLCELMAGPPSRLEEAAARARSLWKRSFTLETYRDRVASLMASIAARGCRAAEARA